MVDFLDNAKNLLNTVSSGKIRRHPGLG